MRGRIGAARSALTWLACAAASLLASCSAQDDKAGGMQPTIVAPSTTRLVGEAPQRRVRSELYVANRGNNTITIYRGRRETPVRTISNGVDFGNFSYLVLEKVGNLYCANFVANTVTVYAKGSVIADARR
jgi:hypothetical protein